jgi:hypothetical protein
MTILTVTHASNAGFYSNCSVILNEIISFYNMHNKLPSALDTTDCFAYYKKPDDMYDVFKDYFVINDIQDLPLTKHINFHHSYQFDVFKNIQHIDSITLVAEAYFKPTQEILDYVESFTREYSIDYDNTCVLFYRGNDKVTETRVGDYSDFVERALQMYQTNPKFKFLIQSDETDFIEFCCNRLPNCVVFYDKIRHIKRDTTKQVDHLGYDNNLYAKYFLAIMIIMAKCRTTIFNSGNISLWIYLFRQMYNKSNANNVQQFLHYRWFV